MTTQTLTDKELAELCMGNKPYVDRDILADIQQLATAYLALSASAGGVEEPDDEYNIHHWIEYSRKLRASLGAAQGEIARLKDKYLSAIGADAQGGSMYGIPKDELPMQQHEAMAVDEDMRWAEIQRISHDIAHADRAPTDVESALCGAVVRAKEFKQRAEAAEQRAAGMEANAATLYAELKEAGTRLQTMGASTKAIEHCMEKYAALSQPHGEANG